MTSIIGYCGLTCSECPAYKATVDDDDALRAKTASEWSKMFNVDIPPVAINCMGCNTEGVKFHHCSECKIRSCGEARAVENCADCSEYACEKLEEFFKMVPEAKETLDGLRE